MPVAPTETPENEDEPVAAPAAPAGMGMADNAAY